MHQLSVKEERTIARARSILERQLRSADLPRFDAPTAVKAYLSTRFAGIDHEQVHALYLNAQHVLIAAEVAAIGSLTHASLSPREIARAALRHNAAAVILAHNHPSGLAEPSRADMMLTEAVRAALGLVEVRLLDHVVVAAGVVVSASERGRL